MPSALDENTWKTLLGRIRDGKCTPFLGAGACHGVLPLGSDIAQQWACKHDYPLDDCADLARVSQFLAVKHDPMFPKEEILKQFFDNAAPPDFSDPDEPHRVLACLPLPIYMTTNYDHFMTQALESQHKNPQRALCRWNRFVRDQPCVFDEHDPTPEEPVVFHLHGCKDIPESLVLTEDDYLDFLVNISGDQHMLHPRIQKALAGTSLLFMGYSLADWDFRVLFRGLVMSTESSLRRISVTVQLPPMAGDDSDTTQERVQSYLTEYFGQIQILVYWGTARQFAAELRQRWEDFSHGG